MFMSGGEEELQTKTEQLERMNVRLDEIMDELKQSSHKKGSDTTQQADTRTEEGRTVRKHKRKCG